MVDKMCSGLVLALEVRLLESGGFTRPVDRGRLLRHFAPMWVLGMSIWVSEMLSMMGHGCFFIAVILDAQFPRHCTAKELYPDTIRAIFGQDRVRNAIHCTDLPKDGIIQCKYFFKILCNLLVA
jgi:hypothetical protein